GFSRSGPDGRFTVHGALAGAELELTASRGELRTPQAVTTRAGAEGPVRLSLDNSRAVAMSGRVVDEGGQPVSGARVHLRALARYETGQIDRDDLVEFGNGVILVADSDGAFRTPNELDREGEYAVFAEAPGMASDHTPWTGAKAGNFPDL